MRTSVNAILAAVLILAGGSWCYAAEQIENPQYKAWAKYKPGTTVTLKTETDMGGNKADMETTTTLSDLTAEKAVVETKMTMVAAGQKMEMPANKMDIPAKIDKVVDVAATMPDAPKADVKESTETLDIAGQKIKCKCVETKTTKDGTTSVAKVWTSEEVPGGLVKMDSTMDGTMKGTTKMIVTALSVK